MITWQALSLTLILHLALLFPGQRSVENSTPLASGRPLSLSLKSPPRPLVSKVNKPHSQVTRPITRTSAAATLDSVSQGQSAIRRKLGLIAQWHEWLQEHVTYPERSRQLGEEGRLRLQLFLRADGSLERWHTTGDSPHWRLVQAVEEAMLNLPPQLQVPGGVTLSAAERQVELTLMFSLKANGATVSF